jgi:uncharacterized protein
MLSLDVRSLAKHAAEVAGELEPTDPVWSGADVIPAKPLRVTGRISSAGAGKYYWLGHIEGTAEEDCKRCLEPVNVPVSESFRAIFAVPGSEEADDPDVYIIDPASDVLDLRPTVREQWLLSVPRFVLCAEGCKGLCHGCGENLNVSSCTCTSAPDSRWDALKSVHRG